MLFFAKKLFMAGVSFFVPATGFDWAFNTVTRIRVAVGMAVNHVAGLAFFTSATGVLQKLVVGLGAGLGIWGVINLMEGYGNDNPGAKSQGMKQLIAGGGVALIGITLVPLLANIFS